MKKSYIELICDKCLKKYQIRKSSYYRRKQFNRPNLCNDCMHKYVGNRNKEVWQNKSSEEKIYHAKQSSEINKKRFANKSPEEQQLQIYKLQKGYADYINNLTSEEKDKLSEKHREVWNKKTELEKEEFIKKQQEIWNNKTLAEQMKCISRLHSGHKHYIETRTEEQRILHNNKISKGVKKAWDSMDINERKILITRAIENLNNFRKNESANNKKERYIKNSIKCRENIKNMTYNERVKNNLNTIYIKNKNAIINTQIIITNHLDKMKYDNEREFMRVLIINDIEFIYQWYNIYEHPKFKELFPNNIITGYNYVSPFHRWDFKILTNKCDIFIDIDGSIHDESQNNYYRTLPSGNKILMKDLISFYDSQRKYQTDNSPAYIIQCYNDKLTLDDKVINIYNDNNIMSLKEFINIIKEYDNCLKNI